MLTLRRDAEGFLDDTDPSLRWVVPDGLEPIVDAAGVPQVFVVRGPEAGVLTLRLRPRWPGLDARHRQATIASSRVRLVGLAAGVRSDGVWHDGGIDAEHLLGRALALDAIELAMIRRLAASGGDTLEVELEMAFEGLLPRHPWLVRIDGAGLRARLVGLLGDTTFDRSAWNDAWAGLGDDALVWWPLSADAIPVPRDEARVALAQHCLPLATTGGAQALRLRDDFPERLALDLSVATAGRTQVALRWSLSSFLAQVADPTVHLVEATIPDPFQAAAMHVSCDVPLAEAGVRSIDVEVTTGGPSGRLRHVFVVGAPTAVRLPFVRESAAALEPRWLARATVVTAAGPTVVETTPRATGLVLDLDAAALGIVPLRFVADPIVFNRVAAIEIEIGARRLQLTATAAEAWAVGRTPPPSVAVTAIAADGRRHGLGNLALARDGLRIGAATLGIGDDVTVVLTPPAQLEDRAAYLAVQVEGGPWQTLERGDRITWALRREDALTPPRLRYRTRDVPRDADGRSRPMRESAWIEAVGETITVALPTTP